MSLSLGDLFVPRVYPGGGFSDQNPGKERKKRQVDERLRIFNSSTLTVTPIANYSDDSWLDLVRTEMSEEGILNKLQHYKEAQEDAKKYNVLNSNL